MPREMHLNTSTLKHKINIGIVTKANVIALLKFRGHNLSGITKKQSTQLLCLIKIQVSQLNWHYQKTKYSATLPY